MDVAEHLIGIAHVLRQQAKQRLVRPSLLVEFHRRDLDALLKDLPGAQGILGATDVGDMADGAHQADHISIAKDRRHHGDVEQMASAQPGIVGDERIAGSERMRGVFFQQRLHRAGQRQVEHRHGAWRMRQRLALGIE